MIKHEYVTVNGIKLHIAKAGKGKKLVILLHGWPEFWYTWRYQIPVLAEKFTVVAPDLRGFNLSDKPKEYILKGSIELHGIKKNISIKANLTKRNDGVLIESDFTLNASDFEITIPAFVKSKLTDVIKVNVGFLVK